MAIVLTVDDDAVALKLRQTAAVLPRAAARALNRSATQVVTVLVRETAKDLGVPQKLVREHLRVRRASDVRPVATITTRGERIPLIDLRARGPEPSRGRGSGVSYTLRGRRQRIPEAFIATVRGRSGAQRGGGHRGVFRRIGGERRSRGGWSLNLPIVELFGPSVPVAMGRAPVMVAARARYAEVIEGNLRHEIDFAVGRIARR